MRGQHRALWAAALLAATVALAGCTRKADPEGCEAACGRLAELLAADRSDRGAPAAAGLDPGAPEGRENLDACRESCVADGTARHLACLLAAPDLDAWIACDGR